MVVAIMVLFVVTAAVVVELGAVAVIIIVPGAQHLMAAAFAESELVAE